MTGAARVPVSSSRRTPGPMDAAQPASARTIGIPSPWVPACAGMTKGEGNSLSPNAVIPAQAGIHTRGPHDPIATPARLDPRLRGDDEGVRRPVTMTGVMRRPSRLRPSVRRSTLASSSRRKLGPMNTTHPASARTISVPSPWVPACAGMTKGEGNSLSPKSVIPAQAGIHTRGPHGVIATPARLDSRLRGDDEGRGGISRRGILIDVGTGQLNPVRHQL